MDSLSIYTIHWLQRVLNKACPIHQYQLLSWKMQIATVRIIGSPSFNMWWVVLARHIGLRSVLVDYKPRASAGRVISVTFFPSTSV